MKLKKPSLNEIKKGGNDLRAEEVNKKVNEEDWTTEIEELQYRRRKADEMGGEDSVKFQHSRGKLTVRERIEKLLDNESFYELGKITGRGEYNEEGEIVDFTPSNSVIGTGKINGKKLIVSGDDFTVRAGSSESAVSDKWVYAERMAHEWHMPLIRLVDTAGGSVRILEQQQGTKIPGYARWPHISLLGRVPVVGVALGACAGLGALKVGVSHFSVMVKEQSHVFAGGPPVVKQGLGQDVTKEELGGWRIHTKLSGAVQNVAETEEDAIEQVKTFLSFMPRNVWQVPERTLSLPPSLNTSEELNHIIPKNRRKVYKVRKILELVFDQDSIFEMSRYFGGSTVTCLARLDGYTVGVIANDPIVMGGAMNIQAAQKTEKFVDMCDTFHIPIINFVDQPGVMSGVEAEKTGTLSSVIRALGAIEQASSPWCSIVIRRAFGLGGGAHGPKHGPDGRSLNHRFAWPSARWGSIPIEGGVAAAYKREINASDDPVAFREKIEEYYHKLSSPYRTAEKFGIVDIIEPSETRATLCNWIEDAYELTKEQVGLKMRTMR
jgi:acetyl-CoA carboxylase carboxyltransferase component